MTNTIYTRRDLLPIGQRKGEVDTVRERRLLQNDNRIDLTLLNEAENAWISKEDFRKERDRTIRYTFDDQWSDTISQDGVIALEKEVIRRQGNIPLQNNVMFPLYFSITGLHSKEETEPVCYAYEKDSQKYSEMMSSALQRNWQKTLEPLLMDSIFGELLLSGAGFAYEKWKKIPGCGNIEDAYTEFVNPYNMFWKCGDDPRNLDIYFIGRLIDMTVEQMYNVFARKKYGLTTEDIDALYHPYKDRSGTYSSENAHEYDNKTFYVPDTPDMCRVIEVWKQESRARYQVFDPLGKNADDMYYRLELNDKKSLNEIIAENKERNAMYDMDGVPKEDRLLIEYEVVPDLYWYYEFLTPDGFILAEGETPYDHKSHPFTVVFFPYINGKPIPYQSITIDQQRLINRMVTMQDMSVRQAVKGWKILPLSMKPQDMTIEEYKKQATSFDAVLVYDDVTRPGSRNKPEMITHSAFNIGTNELLQTELNLVHEISGVQGALQGKAPVAGTSGALYNLQAQNATTTLYGLIKRFGTFKEQVAQKKCQVMQQFYQNGRNVTKNGAEKQMFYDSSADDVTFATSIHNSASSPTYQMVLDQVLQNMYDKQVIDARMLIKYSSNIPHREEILQDLDSQAQLAQQGQMPQQPVNVPGANQQQVQELQDIMKNYPYEVQYNGRDNSKYQNQ